MDFALAQLCFLTVDVTLQYGFPIMVFVCPCLDYYNGYEERYFKAQSSVWPDQYNFYFTIELLIEITKKIKQDTKLRKQTTTTKATFIF